MPLIRNTALVKTALLRHYRSLRVLFVSLIYRCSGTLAIVTDYTPVGAIFSITDNCSLTFSRIYANDDHWREVSRTYLCSHSH